jgi:two-component system, OmpR family, response regulator
MEALHIIVIGRPARCKSRRFLQRATIMPMPLKIMYVDDDADIRTIVRFSLADEKDFDLKMCSSGQEALDTVGEFQPDVVLLDVMMPGMDGPTTMKRLHLLPGFEQVPVAFVTARVQPQEVNQLIALGAIEVIAKPFDPMLLPGQVRQLWADRRNG